ncbi:MAG: hypothetical protein GY797_30765 [Deltaproteobacteria bacterium]|nr:hypothetical protein [Deltaproteobacteria bacterium]
MNDVNVNKGKIPTDLKSILGYLTLIGLGFGFAILLVNYGVYLPDTKNFVPIKEYNDDIDKLKNQHSKRIEILSVDTLILDVDQGKQRVIILKDRLDNIPFFIPTTASATGDLTSKEK